MEQWSERMGHRLTIFAFEQEDKALFHYSRAERFTVAYFLSHSLLLLLFSSSFSGYAVYWPCLSLSFTFAYFSSLLRPIASFHRIHDRLDLLAKFQHTRFGIDFLRIGLRYPHIPTPPELRFKMVKRRVKTVGFVLLVAVFAVVMSLACRWLPPPPAADMCVNCVSVDDEGLICCSLS